MDTATTKIAKNERNISKRANQEESFEKLRTLFLKTEEMKEESETRHNEMESQFKELQQRLKTSSGFLNQIKKSIENIKFSYQRDILDLDKVTDENRDEMERQIEEIRLNIGRLQSKKEERPKPQTYQEAFTDVIASLQQVNSPVSGRNSWV